jgi:hypothetical protein
MQVGNGFFCVYYNLSFANVFSQYRGFWYYNTILGNGNYENLSDLAFNQIRRYESYNFIQGFIFKIK